MPRYHRDDAGFTLVELLIVVLVISILAAIVIPFYYLGQQNSRDAGAKSDLEHAKTALISYWAEKGQAAATPTFDAAASTGLSKYGYTKSAGSTTSVSFATGAAPTLKSFCIQEVGVSTNSFHVTESAGISDGGC